MILLSACTNTKSFCSCFSSHRCIQGNSGQPPVPLDDAGEKICKADQLKFKLTFFTPEDKMMLEEGAKINEFKNYNKSIKWIDSTNKFLGPHFKC